MTTTHRVTSSSVEPLRHLDSVEAGHLEVEQADIRFQPERLCERIRPVLALGDDVDVRLQPQQGCERGADHRLVVGEQHPDHRSILRLRGIVTTIVKRSLS